MIAPDGDRRHIESAKAELHVGRCDGDFSTVGLVKASVLGVKGTAHASTRPGLRKNAKRYSKAASERKPKEYDKDLKGVVPRPRSCHFGKFHHYNGVLRASNKTTS